jgi:hypothetical protein
MRYIALNTFTARLYPVYLLLSNFQLLPAKMHFMFFFAPSIATALSMALDSAQHVPACPTKYPYPRCCSKTANQYTGDIITGVIPGRCNAPKRNSSS